MPTSTANRTDVPEKGEGGKGEGGGNPPHPAEQHEHMHSRSGNKVYKSGPLFLSSKGIGWTSWKKRWFILTRTSLVFFRSDPNAAPQKGGEVNLTLGGIDLNNSGSVVVKADKKLLTVLFPDGRDGRAFTLKAETLEDLYEWKAALEEALEQAPSAALVPGPNGTINKDENDTVENTKEQSKDRQPPKSMVIGRPILLALEDIDGTPSFLEKGLRFIEEHGVKTEGILRQAADVDDVNRRIQDYEQGKTEFTPQEDAHVIADCIKYILRELPSSPVPASCCKALLEACRTERGRRVAAMREAICETFPEPNRRLLQRILMMMQTVASHKADNRMSTSAVAACMAPLLLRPLLNGECELEHDFDVGGDGSLQLLQAAAAANHAQAIVITLLEEYNSIFGEGALMSELYSESDEYGTESEELTDDEEFTEDDEYEDEEEGLDSEVDDDPEHASDASYSDTGDSQEDEICDNKDVHGLPSKSSRSDGERQDHQKLPSVSTKGSLSQKDIEQRRDNSPKRSDNISVKQANKSGELSRNYPTEMNSEHKSSDRSLPSDIQEIFDGSVASGRRGPAKKKLPTEPTDFTSEDEAEIERLEKAKLDLQNQLAEEVKLNAILQSNLERRKNALRERRMALELDVVSLQDQLQKENELRAVLEAGLYMAQGSLPISSNIDEKTKAELAEMARVEVDVMTLKQKADDLQSQVNQQSQKNAVLAARSQTANIPTDSKGKDESESAANIRSIDRSTTKDTAQNSEPARAAASEPTMSIATASKMLVARAEGANATSSALAKLTNRLNFLKERREKLANEAQAQAQASSESCGKRSEPPQQSGSESSQNVDQGLATQGGSYKGPPEGHSTPHQRESSSNTDKVRKSDSKTSSSR